MSPLWGAGQEIETKIDDLTVDVADVNTDVLTLGATARLGAINGIDRGSVIWPSNITTVDVTIGAVVLARAEESFLGHEQAQSSSVAVTRYGVKLTQTTTLRAYRDTAGPNYLSVRVIYRVTEYQA